MIDYMKDQFADEFAEMMKQKPKYPDQWSHEVKDLGALLQVTVKLRVKKLGRVFYMRRLILAEELHYFSGARIAHETVKEMEHFFSDWIMNDGDEDL